MYGTLRFLAMRAGPGTVIKLTSDLFKLPVVRDTMTVETWSPPRRYDVSHVYDLGPLGKVPGTGAFILEPAAGGTIFVWQEHLRPPLGPVGEVGWKLLLQSQLARGFGRSMDNVRRLAEQENT
jgi:Polyketide cyclase / dehydrase and lipid transport